MIRDIITIGQLLKNKKTKTVILYDLLYLHYHERIQNHELFIYMDGKPYRITSTPKSYIVQLILLPIEEDALFVYEDEWHKLIS